jgi:hypothetical protein
VAQSAGIRLWPIFQTMQLDPTVCNLIEFVYRR